MVLLFFLFYFVFYLVLFCFVLFLYFVAHLCIAAIDREAITTSTRGQQQHTNERLWIRLHWLVFQ